MIQISSEEKTMLKADLVAGTSGVQDFETTNFYKVNDNSNIRFRDSNNHLIYLLIVIELTPMTTNTYL